MRDVFVPVRFDGLLLRDPLLGREPQVAKESGAGRIVLVGRESLRPVRVLALRSEHLGPLDCGGVEQQIDRHVPESLLRFARDLDDHSIHLQRLRKSHEAMKGCEDGIA